MLLNIIKAEMLITKHNLINRAIGLSGARKGRIFFLFPFYWKRTLIGSRPVCMRDGTQEQTTYRNTEGSHTLPASIS